MNKFKETDRIQLGQLIRFKGHTLDVATKTINIDVEERKSDLEDLKELLEEWKQRGYPEGPDIVWARERIQNFKKIKKVDISNVHIPPVVETISVEKDIFSVIKNRRSVRFWKKKPVPKNIIEKIIEAASYAPTAFNRMEWRFYIAETPLENMVQCDAINASMPQFIGKATAGMGLAPDAGQRRNPGDNISTALRQDAAR